MSNYTNEQAASLAALQAVAIGEARGSTSLTSFAMICQRDVAAGAWSADDAGTLYGSRFEWLNAENVALGKDVVNVPAGKSLASQVSKFRAFLQCGVYARTNADVREVMETAVLAAKNNYKKSQASAAAVRDVLALDGDADAETMLSAALVAQEGLTKGPETAADAFEKIAKLWDKFRENHAETVRDVHAARPAIADDLAAMLTKFGAALSIAENEKLLRLI